MHTIVRTHTATGQQMVCVGSSPLSHQPWWAELGADSNIQPLLLRDPAYAQWCADIAKRDDPLRAEHTYSVGSVEFAL